MAGRTADLYLQIGGSSDGLVGTSKVAIQALFNVDKAAGDVAAAVDDAFAKMAKGVGDPLKEMERSAKRTFDQIRANAQAALAAPDDATAANLLNAAGADKRAASAETVAQNYRVAADAAARYTSTLGDEAVKERELAIVLEVQARQMEERAVALRDQANLLGAVAKEAGIAADGNEELSRSHNRMGASGMIAEHVVRSFADSVAAGQSPLRAMSMELPRAVEAITFFAQETDQTTGIVGKFAGFMGSGWGVAIMAATSLLGPLIVELLQADDALDAGVDKLKKDAEATSIADRAHAAFKKTIEGEIETQRKLTEELDRQIRTQRQVQQGKVLEQQGNLDRMKESRPGLVGQIAGQQKVVNTLRDQLGSPSLDPDAAAGLAMQTASAEAELKRLQTQLTSLDESIAQGAQGVREAEAPLIQSDVAASLDARTAAVLRYQKALGLLNQRFKLGSGKTGTVQDQQADGSYKPLQITGIDRAEYQRQLAAITKQRDDTEKAASDAKRADRAPTSAGDALLHSAEQYRGLSETRDRGQLMDLFKQAGMNVDPKMVAWCAAFVNAVLATNGLKGTGSLSAQSFLQYGKATNAPEKGDIVVSKRQGGGHVGFFDGYDQAGNVRVLGGNTADRVGVETVRRGDVLGYRRAPTSAAQQVTSAADQAHTGEDMLAKAETDRLKAQQAALGKADQDQLALKLQQIDAERDKLIADALHAATDGKIADALAKQLVAIYTDTAQIEAGNATRVEMTRLAKQQLEEQKRAQKAELDARATALQLQAPLATTRRQKQAIAFGQLDVEETRRKQAARGIMADPDTSLDDWMTAKGQYDQVDSEHGARVADINRQYAAPMDQYRQQLQSSVGDMDDALQGVEVGGLKSLSEGLTGIISGTESVASAFKKMAASIISDLIRIAAEKLILSVIGFKDGTIGTPSAGFATGIVPAFADGIIRGAGTGTSDSIPGYMEGLGLIRVSNGESIINAESTRRYRPLLKAINDKSLPSFATGLVPSDSFYMRPLPSPAAVSREAAPPQYVYLTVDKSALFDVHVQRAAAPLAQAAVIGGSQQAQQDIAEDQSQRIPT